MTDTLIAEIKEQLADAMRERDDARRDTLRLILSSLQGAEKELQRPLTEDEELQVLQRERKKRVEAAEAFRNAGREELATGEEAEARLIENYLPAELPDDSLRAIVAAAVAETGAQSPKDMGQVMKAAMAVVGTRADGKRVSALVREALTR